MLPPALETALTPLARATCKPLHDRIKKAASQCSDRGAANGRYLLAGITAPIISKMEDFTMTRFDYVLPTDIGTLEGAVEDAVNLLSIFSEWFEESHKVMQLDRSHTADDLATIWADAPKYDSLLSSVFFNLTDLQKTLKAESDRQYQEWLKQRAAENNTPVNEKEN